MSDFTPRVPYADLPSEYQALRDEILAAIDRVCERAAFAGGPFPEQFENAFAARMGPGVHAAAVSSGTSALHLALLAAEVGAGDEVITVPMTFEATVRTIQLVGATPVLVDIHPETYTLDPAKLEAAITPRTRAVIPVHLYGHPADMDPILEIARRHRLVVIEDAAQSVDARYRGRVTGTIGDLSCFSFYPGKNLGAYGEGGLVASRDAELVRRVRALRTWGAEKLRGELVPGFNYRMDGIQAAVLGVKLGYLESWTQARREVAARYAKALRAAGIQPPPRVDWAEPVHHVYAVRAPRRDAVVASLRGDGIDARVHYPLPVHAMPHYASLGVALGELPESERLAAEEISLPIFPGLSAQQLDDVVASLRRALERSGGV